MPESFKRPETQTIYLNKIGHESEMLLAHVIDRGEQTVVPASNQSCVSSYQIHLVHVTRPAPATGSDVASGCISRELGGVIEN